MITKVKYHIMSGADMSRVQAVKKLTTILSTLPLVGGLFIIQLRFPTLWAFTHPIEAYHFFDKGPSIAEWPRPMIADIVVTEANSMDLIWMHQSFLHEIASFVSIICVLTMIFILSILLYPKPSPESTFM